MTPKKKRWRRPFLESLSIVGSVRHATEAAGISRNCAYHHRKKDPEFAAAWDRAIDVAADRLEEEARRRAVLGVKRLKFHNGKPIMVPGYDDEGKPILDENGVHVLVPYVEHEHSDTLLIFLLKGIRPEKYRERRDHNHNQSVVGIVPVREEIVLLDQPAELPMDALEANGRPTP